MASSTVDVVRSIPTIVVLVNSAAGYGSGRLGEAKIPLCDIDLVHEQTTGLSAAKIEIRVAVKEFLGIPRVIPIMNTEQNPLSRRKWLAAASTVAASAGAGFLAAKANAAEPEKIISSGSPGARIYDIRDFGAKGDGVTLDTKALQSAIDACNKDQGGTVLVPAGTFVIGTTEIGRA